MFTCLIAFPMSEISNVKKVPPEAYQLSRTPTVPRTTKALTKVLPIQQCAGCLVAPTRRPMVSLNCISSA
eukprot:6213416-Pleurochrysis_carterae.AAC.10